jgi:hypothetical protein
MLIVPAHQKDTLSILEGALIGNRNLNASFAGSAETIGSTFGPLSTVKGMSAIQESRVGELRCFGDLLPKESRRMRDRIPGLQESSPGQR